MNNFKSTLAPLCEPQVQPAHLWWQRPGLVTKDNRLEIAGHDAHTLAQEHGTPLFVYDLDRFEDNYFRLHRALEKQQHPFRVYYAMKANRFAPLLKTLLRHDVTGIDTASPGEVLAALEAGFPADRITFTNVSVSRRDVEKLKGLDIMLNCDSLSMIDKIADVDPGRSIGIRINPQIGVGINENLTYAGLKPTKFGIYLDRLDEALRMIDSRGLKLQGLHMHVGCGWTGSAITQFFRAVEKMLDVASDVIDRNGPLEYINFGGGLGVPLSHSDGHVDVNLYARGIAERVRELDAGIQICVEPGDYMVKDTGVLLAEVVMNEEKGGEQFVGVDTGFNVHCGASHYALYQEFVHATRASEPGAAPVTIVGNINEVVDVFADQRPMPHIEEGEILAMLNAGGYGTSMTSNHCLRDAASEIAVSQRGNPFATV